jgi:hypothetical protein
VFELRKTRTSVGVLIHDMFPESVTLCWYSDYKRMVTIHYLARDRTEIFCCIQDVWWKLNFHEAVYIDRGEADYVTELDSAIQVDPPEGVIYSHSESLGWNEEFDPHQEACVKSQVWHDYDCLNWVEYSYLTRD